MTETVDPHIPLSLLISRLEKHRDEMLKTRAELPAWAWKRRAQLTGAVTAYQCEINAALQLAATCQPIIGKRSSLKAWEEPRRKS